jgi:hypothetical protein
MDIDSTGNNPGKKDRQRSMNDEIVSVSMWASCFGSFAGPRLRSISCLCCRSLEEGDSVIGSRMLAAVLSLSS